MFLFFQTMLNLHMATAILVLISFVEVTFLLKAEHIRISLLPRISRVHPVINWGVLVGTLDNYFAFFRVDFHLTSSYLFVHSGCGVLTLIFAASHEVYIVRKTKIISRPSTNIYGIMFD